MGYRLVSTSGANRALEAGGELDVPGDGEALGVGDVDADGDALPDGVAVAVAAGLVGGPGTAGLGQPAQSMVPSAGAPAWPVALVTKPTVTESPTATVAAPAVVGHRDLAAAVRVAAVPQAGQRRAGRQPEGEGPARHVEAIQPVS